MTKKKKHTHDKDPCSVCLEHVKEKLVHMINEKDEVVALLCKDCERLQRLFDQDPAMLERLVKLDTGGTPFIESEQR